jgi:(p)ppGpp synthase/HD superfamily hydrolase
LRENDGAGTDAAKNGEIVGTNTIITGADKSDSAEAARTLSARVHATQVDRAGQPYATHPARVAQRAAELADLHQLSADERATLISAAYLHDVVEDSGENGHPDVTTTDLSDLGFTAACVEIVRLVTKTGHGTTDDSYYEAIVENTLARLTKIADISDNSNISRQQLLAALGRPVKQEKYLHAIALMALTEIERAWFDRAIQLPAV